jgi:hypothetical protein
MMSDHATAAGLFLVGGAGNFRTTQPIPVQHQSPKDVPSVKSVGGIDTLCVLRPFSSMGPAEWSTVALYGDHPGKSVWRVREIIEGTARDLGEPGKDNMFGYALVDAYAAVLEARKEGAEGL